MHPSPDPMSGSLAASIPAPVLCRAAHIDALYSPGCGALGPASTAEHIRMPVDSGASLRSLHSSVISSVVIERGSATSHASTMLARSRAAVTGSIGGVGGGDVALTAGPQRASRRRNSWRVIGQA